MGENTLWTDPQYVSNQQAGIKTRIFYTVFKKTLMDAMTGLSSGFNSIKSQLISASFCA